jgi:hypothetical protein
VDGDIRSLLNRKGLNYFSGINDQIYNQHIKGKKWYVGLHIDHVIPKTLGKISPYKEILAERSNKQLLHKNCHINKKTALDVSLIKLFRKFIERELRLINKKITTATPQELFRSNYHAIQYLIKDETTLFYSKEKYILNKLKKVPLSQLPKYTSTQGKIKVGPKSHRLENIERLKRKKSIKPKR